MALSELRCLLFVFSALANAGVVQGGLVGTLPNIQHGISGNFYIVDSKTIFIENFNYDATAPGAFLYYYRPGDPVSPSGGGFNIPLSPPVGQGSGSRYPGAFRQEGRFNNENIMVTLPDGVDACDIGTITVWCQPFRSIFTQLEVPRSAFINDGNDPCTLVLQENQTATVTPGPSINVTTLESTIDLPSNVPLAAIVVPPIFFLMLITILIIAIPIIIIQKKVRTAANEEIYSVVGPPSLPIRTNKNTSYEESTALYGLQKITNMQAMTNRSHQGLSDEGTGTNCDENPVVGHNPAYGTNIAMAPEIENERNEAYSSNVHSVHPELGDSQSSNLQRAPDHFAMAANSAYGTNVAIAPDIDTQENLAYEHIM